MHEHSDYLREQAAKYRDLAAKADDSLIKKEFLELANICKEIANDMDDRRVTNLVVCIAEWHNSFQADDCSVIFSGRHQGHEAEEAHRMIERPLTRAIV